MAEEVTSIKWHPGFCSAMELEFSRYKDMLDFSREFPLSKEPLRIDLLMIKKVKDIVLDIGLNLCRKANLNCVRIDIVPYFPWRHHKAYLSDGCKPHLDIHIIFHHSKLIKICHTEIAAALIVINSIIRL